MSVNKVILIGRLGTDPEVKHIESASGASAVVNFNLATGSKWKDKQGNQQEKTEWHRVVAWGKLAEICGQYLKKGSQAYVEGSLETRQWEDKQGAKRYTTEVKAQVVRFLGGDEQSTARHEPQNNQATGVYDEAATAILAQEDVPF